jgi:hydrogenase-4 membrane subunit HyfE
MASLLIGSVLSGALAVSLWLYETTRSELPFVATAVGSLLITVGVVWLTISVIAGKTFIREGGLSLLIPFAIGCVGGCSFLVFLAWRALKPVSE